MKDTKDTTIHNISNIIYMYNLVIHIYIKLLKRVVIIYII